jgi:hypothetical protein
MEMLRTHNLGSPSVNNWNILGGLQEVIDRFAENYFLVLKFSQSKIIRQVYRMRC